MLLLRAPRFLKDRQSGWHISIRASNDSGEQVAELSGQCNCPRHVFPTIIACITYSGRYDCVISAGVGQKRLDWFVAEIENLGGHVVVTKVSEI